MGGEEASEVGPVSDVASGGEACACASSGDSGELSVIPAVGAETASSSLATERETSLGGWETGKSSADDMERCTGLAEPCCGPASGSVVEGNGELTVGPEGPPSLDSGVEPRIPGVLEPVGIPRPGRVERCTAGAVGCKAGEADETKSPGNNGELLEAGTLEVMRSEVLLVTLSGNEELSVDAGLSMNEEPSVGGFSRAVVGISADECSGAPSPERGASLLVGTSVVRCTDGRGGTEPAAVRCTGATGLSGDAADEVDESPPLLLSPSTDAPVSAEDELPSRPVSISGVSNVSDSRENSPGDSVAPSAAGEESTGSRRRAGRSRDGVGATGGGIETTGEAA